MPRCVPTRDARKRAPAKTRDKTPAFGYVDASAGENAVPDTAGLLQMFDRWIGHLGMCSTLPIGAPACRSLWEWIMYLSAALGATLAAWAVWRIVDYRFKLAAALRAETERQRVADADTMRAHTWVEAGDIAADVTDPHLSRKIRDELERQRTQNLRR